MDRGGPRRRAPSSRRRDGPIIPRRLRRLRRGGDAQLGRFTYGASIPITKAMSPEVLLAAYSMNDEPLAPEHGFPLRVVVPGFAGVRSPKWLTTITVQDRPSDNHMQQRDYKLMP